MLGKSLPPGEPIGESWELFDFPPGVVEGTSGWVSARVAEGPLAGTTLHELVTDRAGLLLGEVKPLTTGAGPQFPLLVKFLDAREDLSIQVHPSADYARRHPEAHLKTECWVVLAAERGARLYKGLRPVVTREAFAAACRDGTVTGLIETTAAVKGECHYLPSGLVHALGAGVLVAEVQTPSDTTFRVHDFGRVEPATGKPRALHLEQALECIDFSGEKPPLPTSTRRPEIPLVECEHFKTVTIKASARQIRPVPRGQMRIWVVLEGTVRLRHAGTETVVRAGGTVLLPAALPRNVVASFPENVLFLETTVPVRP